MSVKAARQMLGAGRTAPGFHLSASDNGAPRDLADLLAAGPVALAFFKVSCPVCQYTFPFLDRLHRTEASRIRVVGISQDDDFATEAFRQRYGVSFPVLIDPENKGYTASNAYGITHVPSVFVVEPGGVISHAWPGFSKNDMERLGKRAGLESLFRPDENVPEWKAG